MTTPLESVLRRYLTDLVRGGVVPGCALELSAPSRRITLREGYADVEAGVPVLAETRFAVYSVTKVVTALAALRLVADRALRLDGPVADHLPGWVDGGGGTVRLVHLLAHTAGFTYGSRQGPVAEAYRAAGFVRNAPEGVMGEALYRRFSMLPRLFPPGRAWSYSLASDVLGWVLAEVRGRPLQEVLRTEVFEPLGMRDSLLMGDVNRDFPVAVVYRRGETGGWQRAEPVMRDWGNPMAPQSGGGGLITTAADLHGLARALAEQPDTFLPRALWRRCTANHIPGGRDLRSGVLSPLPGRAVRHVGYGLGIAVVLPGHDGSPNLPPGEVGWEGSTGSFLFADPSRRLSVAFLTHAHPFGELPCWRDVRRIVYGYGYLR
ncbi:serine hydrolase [Streptomyces sp. Y2F8-2]|uniref:serine hydrolase domain-containing protein n=1 Tax=Streptomyces sp. Y2F8-2 TaxID=2759675 RepID=UPI0019067A8A|nr:serine hydrolase domain-containing protein [Streptomyces sp. Y2F8-2]GHK01681.1 serine hydrolase [Streptomyces sp. Y2F8-2]